MFLPSLVINNHPDRIHQWFSLLTSSSFKFWGGEVTLIAKTSFSPEDRLGILMIEFLFQAGTRAEEGFLTNDTLDL